MESHMEQKKKKKDHTANVSLEISKIFITELA